ncbi:MAG: hypothetical protein IPK18_11925 [Sphingobacteriales bacterium]|nr:MAG: hypothetical protein IPK18_11925 [Sphingobacteriales bacterium]
MNKKSLLVFILSLFSVAFLFAVDKSDSQTICRGTTIAVDGINYTPYNDTTIEYTIPDILMVEDTNVILSVTVLPLPTKSIDTAICVGATINIDGVDYTPAADTAVEYTILGVDDECDTLATVNITHKEIPTKTIDTAICVGATINIDGVDYTPAADTAVEYTILGVDDECDTLATVNITHKEIPTKTIDTAICVGATINIDGVDYTPAADTAVEYTILGVDDECDTLATVNITHKEIPTKSIDTAICVGATINIDGVDYTPAADTAVEYTISGENLECDTLATVNITHKEIPTKTIDTAI